MPNAAQQNILVIKLGAFGDFIQALGPMAAIRRHHPDAHITLLTTAPFVTIARESHYFDQIWLDERPKLAAPHKVLALSKKLRGGNFTRVYDLQNNDRTAFYLRLFSLNPFVKNKVPEWVGAAPGASHRNTSPDRIAGHAFDGHVQTLALGGVIDVRVDTLDWVSADITPFKLPHPYILIVPGSTPGRPEKRWPAAQYGALARHLYGWGYTPVITGTLGEVALAEQIQTHCPQAINLCGQTSMMDLVGLARGAAGAIGNDTGPMHLIAPTGCPCIVIFSRHSDPLRHAPRGAHVRCVQKDNLNDLRAQDVLEQISGHAFRHKGRCTEDA